MKIIIPVTFDMLLIKYTVKTKILISHSKLFSEAKILPTWVVINQYQPQDYNFPYSLANFENDTLQKWKF